MKWHIITIVTIVFAFMLLCGCNEENSSDTLSGLEYSNSTYKLGINPPAGWTINESDDYGIVRFYGPTVDDFTVNIGISERYNMGSGDTLESIVLEGIEELSNTFEGFNEVSKSYRLVNSMNAYELEVIYSMFGYEIHSKQVLVEKDDSAVTITYAAIESSYDTYMNDFEQSLSTFTII